MIYYGGNDYRDYLAHHGILGQRWGKRNGPPYPLGVGDHSASEKKAGWRDSLDKKITRKAVRAVKQNKKANKNAYKAKKVLLKTEKKIYRNKLDEEEAFGLRNQASNKSLKFEKKSLKQKKDYSKKVNKLVRKYGQETIAAIDSRKIRRGQKAVDKYINKTYRATEKYLKFKKRNDKRFQEQAKRLEKSDTQFSEYLAKEGYSKNSLQAGRNTSRTTIKSNISSDLTVRDRLTTSGTKILNEDLNNHSYIVSVSPKKGVTSVAKVTRYPNTNQIDISAFSKEGLINQNLNKKATKKIKKYLKG